MKKKITFKEIYIEGFGSIIKPLKFDFNRKGVNLITGKNGVGKSTLFNALDFCLHGSVLKGVNNPSIPTKKAYRDNEWKGTKVLLEVVIDKVYYQIARHINYKGKSFGVTGSSTVMIAKNGNRLDIGSEDKRDINNYITTKLLGISRSSFLNAVLFGQKMKRLLDVADAARREVFESMIDLTFLDDALVSCKSDLQHSVSLLDKYIADLSSKKSYKKELKEDIAEAVKDLKELVKDRKSKTSSINKEIQKYRLKLQDSSITQKQIDKLSSKLKSNTITLDKYREESKDRDKLLAAYKSDLDLEAYKYKLLNEELLESSGKVCSKCGSKLNPAAILVSKRDIENRMIKSTKKTRKLDNKVRLHEQSDRQIQETFIKLNEETAQARLKFHRLQNEHTSTDTYKEMITDLKNRLKDVSEDAEEKLSVKISKFKKKHKNLKLSIEELSSGVEQEEKKIKLLEWWSRKGFTGLKQFMFLSFLSKLTVATYKYTAPLGCFVDFSIDTTKASKPFTTKCFNKDAVEYSYKEYSGGEAVKVSVASMLGINDVLCKDVDINIVLFDEVFESLDEGNREAVFEILNLKKGKSIFVITHMKDIDLVNAKNIEIKKKNHNTYIK